MVAICWMVFLHSPLANHEQRGVGGAQMRENGADEEDEDVILYEVTPDCTPRLLLGGRWGNEKVVEDREGDEEEVEEEEEEEEAAQRPDKSPFSSKVSCKPPPQSLYWRATPCDPVCTPVLLLQGGSWIPGALSMQQVFSHPHLSFPLDFPHNTHRKPPVNRSSQPHNHLTSPCRRNQILLGDLMAAPNNLLGQ